MIPFEVLLNYSVLIKLGLIRRFDLVLMNEGHMFDAFMK
ncbi:hypothetical protein ATN83_1217 [Raoultella ornithinolytica]|nr:hypothetical protein ATN83_1217 [Raoultella ornithinolytica]